MPVIVALAACSLAPATPSSTSDEPRITADTGEPYDPFEDGLVGDPEAGAARFRIRCTSCHGPEGRGALGPDLAQRVPRFEALELYRIVTEGNGGAMPRIRLDGPQEAVDIVAWLQVRFGS